MTIFEDPQLWARAVDGLAQSVGRINPGAYWQYFNTVAAQNGVTASQLATAMAATASSQPAAAAAVNGLSQVTGAGLMTGLPAAEAAAIAEAITVAEVAATGTATVGAAATGAAATGTTVAAAEGGGILATLGGMSVAAQIAAAVAAVAVVVAGAWVAGTMAADDPVEPAVGVPAEPRSDEEREQEATSQSEDRTAEGGLPSNTGFVVVQVTNHPGPAVAVLRKEDVNSHEAGETQLYLCNFLHGGNCSDHCVDTPSGNVVCGQDIPAKLSVASEHDAGDAGLEDAWRALCDQFDDVAAPALAEGWVGVNGDSTVTIDWANFIFTARPCVF